MSQSNSTTTHMNSTIDSSNLFYLHPSDHPAMILFSKQIDGFGFGSWKGVMSIALSTNKKNKLGFVDGTITSTENPSLWNRCGSLTRCPGILVKVFCITAQLWTELNDRYGQANGAKNKMYQLQKSLCEFSH
ncbi:putative retrotransposon Copia-like protein [Helianthus debilis subsp. tardiflorus]